MQNPQIQIKLLPSKLLLTLWCLTSFLILLVIWLLPRGLGHQMLASVCAGLPCLWAMYCFKRQQKKSIQLAWQDGVFYYKQHGHDWCEFEPQNITVRLWMIKFSCKYKVPSSVESYSLAFSYFNSITLLPDQLSEKDHRIWRLLLRYNHLN
jgi:hypothetical protein